MWHAVRKGMGRVLLRVVGCTWSALPRAAKHDPLTPTSSATLRLVLLLTSGVATAACALPDGLHVGCAALICWRHDLLRLQHSAISMLQVQPAHADVPNAIRFV